jgi:hypothetical protein
MSIDRQWSRVAVAAAAVVLNCVALRAAEADFVSAVVATRPIGYYRLDSTEGKSQAGSTNYKPVGGVTSVGPGGPIGNASSYFAQLNGRDAYILTTQSGGVGAAASIMAWVNLASLPSAENRFFYVAGESQNGNDLDVQFETDNALRFYTASGGHLSYAPAPATLVNQWHMIVATVDTVSQTRVIYWDGKSVATDKGGGRAGKTGAFSIGASTVFSGRFFKGGIEEVGLWNRALQATEVAAIYAAAKPNASPAGANSSMQRTGPFPTTAKVEAGDSNGPVKLKREEQIAILFLTAFQEIESDCQSRTKRACTFDELVGRLKYDPRTDSNYSYTLAASGLAWEAHASAKKPGLLGFYFFSRSFPQVTATYNATGTAGVIDKELGSRSIVGDSFAVR